MILLVLLTAAFVAAPSAAHAGPILGPIIIGIAGLGGITIAPAVGSFIGNLLVVGAGLLLANKLRPKVPEPEDGMIVKKQTIPPRAWGYGVSRESLKVMFEEVTAGGQAATVGAFVDGRSHAIRTLLMHDDVVVVDEEHRVTPLDGPYGAIVRLQWRLGDNPSSVYDEVRELFPDVYTENFRGDGVTSGMMVCDSPSAKSFQTDYPNGHPTFSVVGEWAFCWDPRDPTQDPEDEATWQWAENPVVHLLHYVCFHPHGYRRPLASAYEPTAAIWKHAMDVCDSNFAVKGGGFIPRFASGGTWDAPTRRAAVVQQLMNCCDGWAAEAGDGSWIVYAGEYVAPDDDFAIEDEHIVAISIQKGVPIEDRAKVIVPTISSPPHLYGKVECQPFGEQALLDQGELAEHAELSLPWVHDWRQADFLAQRENARVKAPLRGVVTTTLYGLGALRRRYVPLRYTKFPSTADIVVEIRKVTISLLTATVMIEFVKADPNVDMRDPEVDEPPAPPVPAPPEVDEMPTPPIPTLQRIDDQIIASSPPVEGWSTLEIQGEYRRGSSDWKEMIVPKGGVLACITPNLQKDGAYEFRTAYVLGGEPGEWSPSAFFEYRADEDTPPAPEATQADPPSGGVVNLSMRAGAEPPNTKRLRFLRKVQGSLDSTAIVLKSAPADPEDVRYWADSPGGGSFTYMFQAANGSGVLSAYGTPRNVTVP